MGFQHRPFTLIGKGVSVPSSNLQKDIHYKPEVYSSKGNSSLKSRNHFTLPAKATLLSANQKFGSNWIKNSSNNRAYMFWTTFICKDSQDSTHLPKHHGTQNWPYKTVPHLAWPQSSRAQQHIPSSIKEGVFAFHPGLSFYQEQFDDANHSKNVKKCPRSAVIKKRFTAQLNNLPAETRSVEYDGHKYVPSKYKTDSKDVEASETKQQIDLSVINLLENGLPWPKLKLNLEFHDRNVKSTDELIERALCLAKKAKEKSEKSRPTTPQKIERDKPPSSDRSHGKAATPVVDWIPQNGPLSANGRKLSFSSRHNRYASARNQRKPSQRPHSSHETPRKPAWKP